MLHSKNAGLKNNPTLTQPLGNYGTEHVLGCFDPECWVVYLTQPVGQFNCVAGLNIGLFVVSLPCYLYIYQYYQ